MSPPRIILLVIVSLVGAAHAAEHDGYIEAYGKAYRDYSRQVHQASREGRTVSVNDKHTLHKTLFTPVDRVHEKETKSFFDGVNTMNRRLMEIASKVQNEAAIQEDVAVESRRPGPARETTSRSKMSNDTAVPGGAKSFELELK